MAAPAEISQIGLIGLGPMGRNLAANLMDRGIAVIAWERDPAVIAGSPWLAAGSIARPRLEDMVAALVAPRCVLMMIASGTPVDECIDRLGALLQPGDIVIDGGNSHPRDTERRQAALHERGIDMLGIGISGGPRGARRGPAIMAGGPDRAWRRVQPALERIAARVDGAPCAGRVGDGGAGHFVKMVHNGIEYAVLQLLAETFDILSGPCRYAPPAVAAAFRALDDGAAAGFLTRVAAEVAAATTADGAFLIDIVDDAAEQKGTGRWTVEAALELGVAVPTLAEAVFSRSLSGDRALRAEAAAARIGAPAPTLPAGAVATLLAPALALATASAFAQGFGLFGAAANRFGRPLDRGLIAALWRGGCVLQGAMVGRLAMDFADEPRRRDILGGRRLRPLVEDGIGALRRLVAMAAGAGVPVPAFASALGYVEMRGRDRLPTRLTQLQRDFFGDHGLHRRDTGAALHGPWHDRPDAS